MMPLFASVLFLDRKAVRALRMVDAYSVHRVVYALFDPTENAQGRFLFADQGGDALGRRILLLSDRPPAPTVQGHGQVQTKPLPHGFLEHPLYRFKVIINPTYRENQTGKRRPVVGREAIATWFAQTAVRAWGFEPDPVRLEVGRVDVLRFADKHKHPVTLCQAQVEGVLRVTDPAVFQHQFAQGLGKGRAFGCGLLQIVPFFETPFD
jgi:CRISPR system Cascade subunit CasE